MRKFAPAFTIALVVVFVISISLSKVFRVSTIICRTESGEQCSTEITERLALFSGKPLFFYDLDAFAKEEVERNQPFELRTLTKELPSYLHVIVVPEEAFITIRTESETIVFTKQGKPLIQQIAADGTNLTTELIIEYLDTTVPITANQNLEPELVTTLNTISSLLGEFKIEFTRITWHSPQEITIELSSGIMVIIDTANPSTALTKLKHILSAPEVANLPRKVREIDLRFSMPVLRTDE